MIARLTGSNTGPALPSLVWATPDVVAGIVPVNWVVSLGDWIPSATMPRPALRQPYGGYTAAPDPPVVGERLDRVLAAGRAEPACRQTHRRHVRPVQLDQQDRCPHRQPAKGPHPGPHRRPFGSTWARVNPARSSCSRRAEIAFRLPGNARITIRSPGSSSVITLRATWRSRRATRCRCTADPTDFPTTSPIRGPGSLSWSHRFACTTMSRSTARTPFFTVEPNSADRVIRCRAGSTVVFRPAQAVSVRRPLRRRFDTTARPARVRIRSRNPCTRDRLRLFGW